MALKYVCDRCVKEFETRGINNLLYARERDDLVGFKIEINKSLKAEHNKDYCPQCIIDLVSIVSGLRPKPQ